MAQIVPGVCRGCIRDVIGEGGVSLRSTAVRELFEECTRLRLPDVLTDRCSQLICAGCYKHCKEWKSFKTLCQDNEHFYWPMQNLSGKETNDLVLDGSDAGELNLLLEEEDEEIEEQDDEDDNLLAILQGDLEEENEKEKTGVKYQRIQLENEEIRIATGGSFNSSGSELINDIRAFLNSGECDDYEDFPVQKNIPPDEEKHEDQAAEKLILAENSSDCELEVGHLPDPNYIAKKTGQESQLNGILERTFEKEKDNNLIEILSERDADDEKGNEIIFQRRTDFDEEESDNIPQADEVNSKAIDELDLEAIYDIDEPTSLNANGEASECPPTGNEDENIGACTALSAEEDLSQEKKTASKKIGNSDAQKTDQKERDKDVDPMETQPAPQPTNILSDDEEKELDEDDMFEIPINSEFGEEDEEEADEEREEEELEEGEIKDNDSWVCPACGANLINSETYRDHLHKHLTDDTKNPERPKTRKRKAEEDIDLLERSVMERENIPKWNCPLCPRSLRTNSRVFYDHFSWQHNFTEDKQKCPLCPNNNKLHRNVSQHIFDVHVEKFKCQFCFEQSPSSVKFKKHNEENHNVELQLRLCRSCPLCEESLTVGGLRQHLQKKHEMTEESTACPCCSAEFQRYTDVLTHILSFHTSKWTCVTCKTRFYSVTSFKQHRNLHKANGGVAKLREQSSTGKVILNLQVKHSTANALDVPSDTDNPADPPVVLHKIPSFVSVREQFKCPSCNRVFSNQQRLNFHFDSDHTPVVIKE